MSDVFEDVEESLRRDALRDFARKYGPAVIAAAVLLLLSAIGYVGYNAYAENRGKEASNAFFAAQAERAKGADGSARAFEEFKKGAPTGYAVLATMEKGAALEQAGDLKGALAAFEQAAAMSNEPIGKQTAQLRAAYIAAETEDLQAVENRVRALIDGRGPLSYLARELVAVEAYEAGNLDRARQELTYLQNAPIAPAELKQRASTFLQLIGSSEAGAQQSPAATPSSTPTTGEEK